MVTAKAGDTVLPGATLALLRKEMRARLGGRGKRAPVLSTTDRNSLWPGPRAGHSWRGHSVPQRRVREKHKTGSHAHIISCVVPT